MPTQANSNEHAALPQPLEEKNNLSKHSISNLVINLKVHNKLNAVHAALLNAELLQGEPVLGLCRWFSIRLIEAGLQGAAQEQRFNTQLRLIVDTPTATLVCMIMLAKVNKDNGLPYDDNLLEILEYYRGVKAYQNKLNFCRFDLERQSSTVSPDNIRQKGGLKKVYGECFIYDKNEIIAYLRQLTTLLATLSELTDKNKIGFLLQSRNHVISLYYYPRAQAWSCIDINQVSAPDLLPTDYIEPTRDFAAIADTIIRGYSADITEPTTYAAFSIQLLLTANDPHIQLLQQNLTPFAASHAITEAIAKREEVSGDNLAVIAARDGYDDTFEKLAPYITDLSKLYINDKEGRGTTLAFLAAQGGHYRIVQILEQHGADLSVANLTDGATPLHIAAQGGHLSVVRILAPKKSCLDKQQLICGATPVFVAAQNGYADIVSTLADAKFDLNLVKRDGCTPLHMAAYNNHPEVVKVLLDKGAALNPLAQEATPLYLAAQNGHDGVVEILVQSKADLTLTCQRRTALFVAARNGHKRVVEILVEHEIRPAHDTVENLKTFAIEQENENIKRRMDDFLSKAIIVDGEFIEIHPIEIARIMGFDEIEAVLRKKLNTPAQAHSSERAVLLQSPEEKNASHLSNVSKAENSSLPAVEDAPPSAETIASQTILQPQDPSRGASLDSSIYQSSEIVDTNTAKNESHHSEYSTVVATTPGIDSSTTHPSLSFRLGQAHVAANFTPDGTPDRTSSKENVEQAASLSHVEPFLDSATVMEVPHNKAASSPEPLKTVMAKASAEDTTSAGSHHHLTHLPQPKNAAPLHSTFSQETTETKQQTFQLHIKTFSSKTVSINGVKPTDFVRDLKEKIRQQESVSNSIDFKIALSGKELDPDKTLNEQNVTPESCLYVIMRQPKVVIGSASQERRDSVKKISPTNSWIKFSCFNNPFASGKSPQYWQDKFNLYNISHGLTPEQKTLGENYMKFRAACFLLMDYCGASYDSKIGLKGGTSVARAMALRWNTHHGEAVRKALDELYCKDGRPQTVENLKSILAEKLGDQNIKANGDLNRILTVIGDETGIHFENIQVPREYTPSI